MNGFPRTERATQDRVVGLFARARHLRNDGNVPGFRSRVW